MSMNSLTYRKCEGYRYGISNLNVLRSDLVTSKSKRVRETL